jgi:ribonuclease J
MKIVEKNPEKYLLITTGNQGEPNSILSRIARNEFKFTFRKEDQIIFSSTVIPSPINRANRHILETSLKEQGVRIMQDVHVSGHAAREDHRDILKMLNPEFVAPSHGETERLSSYAALAAEEGYRIGDTVRIMWNGRSLEL